MFGTRRLITVVLIVGTVGIVAIVAIVVIVAGILFLRSSGKTELVTVATDVGTPTGPATTKSIGPAGGSIASPDGRITVNVPPNDLPGPVEFSITPITNQAQGGLGNAYRLEPDGQKFATPVEVSFKYTDQDLEGSLPEAFTVGYQDDQKAWHLQKTAKLDQAARSITISTTHFTDDALIARLRLSPVSATLHVGETAFISLVDCEEQGVIDRLLFRPLDCSAVTKGNEAWKLAGPGTILPAGSVGYAAHKGVEYTAPAKKPTPNLARVLLTVEIYLWNTGTGATSTIRQTFESRITIIDRGYRASGQSHDTVYSGVICDLEKLFTVKGKGLANLTFNFVPSSPTSGTVNYTTSYRPGGAMASEAGTGSYTVEGIDTDKPRIALNLSGTGSITVGPVTVNTSGKGNVYINLTPLESNECGGK